MTAQRIVLINHRFCGPPNSGNGGYVCGLLSGAVNTALEVRLQRPPPLDRPLHVQVSDTDEVQLLDGESVVATGRPARFNLDVPAAPSYREAMEAALHYAGFHDHPYPGCFVCGPQRQRGDGLRIFAGRLGEGPLHAAPWMPDESLAGADGKVLPEFIWAALDCPGAFSTPAAGTGALLGQFSARIGRRVRANEPCVILGWRVGGEGRKHFAGTALFDENGELCAEALATWIEPRR